MYRLIHRNNPPLEKRKFETPEKLPQPKSKHQTASEKWISVSLYPYFLKSIHFIVRHNISKPEGANFNPFPTHNPAIFRFKIAYKRVMIPWMSFYTPFLPFFKKKPPQGLIS